MGILHLNLRGVPQLSWKSWYQGNRVLTRFLHMGIYNWEGSDICGPDSICSMQYSAALPSHLFKMIREGESKAIVFLILHLERWLTQFQSRQIHDTLNKYTLDQERVVSWVSIVEDGFKTINEKWGKFVGSTDKEIDKLIGWVNHRKEETHNLYSKMESIRDTCLHTNRPGPKASKTSWSTWADLSPKKHPTRELDNWVGCQGKSTPTRELESSDPSEGKAAM